MKLSVGRTQARLLLFVDAIGALLDKHFWLCGGVLLLNVLIVGLITDVRKKLWIDELFTLDVAHQAGPAEIIKTTIEGDNAPPLYSIVVQAILPFVHDDALATRLPSTLGFCGMLGCMLAFGRRRFTAPYAWILTLLVANATFWALTEGRSYGTVLCFGAAALFFWQSAAEGVRRTLSLVLLALALGLMTAFQYYSVFFVVPICVAEAVRWRRSGRFDLGVLASLVAVFPVLLLHYPLIASGRRFLANYWSPAEWANIPEEYLHIFRSLVFVPMAVLVAFWLMRSRGGSRDAGPGLTPQEWAASFAFLAMPLAVVTLSMFTTHIFVGRYILWATLGISMLIAATLQVLPSNKKALGVSVIGVLLAVLFKREIRDLVAPMTLRESQPQFAALSHLPESAERILVPDEHAFMELSYYAGGLRERLVYPLAQDVNIRYRSTNTGDLLMEGLSRRTKLHITPYQTFLMDTSPFLLVAFPSSYWLRFLRESGYVVAPVGGAREPLIYEVSSTGRR
jgi:hypothetical protein